MRRLALLPLALLAGCGSEPAPQPRPETVAATLPTPAGPPAVPTEPAVADEPAPVVLPPDPAPPLPDAATLDAAGLTRIDGDRLTVVTDAPARAADLVPAVAAAWPAWADDFGAPPPTADGRPVRFTAFLMAEPDRFRGAGLLPDDLPPFLTGRQRGRRFWMYDVESPYFRRALAVHEATHAFMTLQSRPGAKGPLWYLEGVAELFGAHRVEADGSLTFRVIPGEEAAVGGWDRLQQVRADVAAGFLPSVDEVRRLDDADFLEGRGYAWAWALCAFLDGTPGYAGRFRRLHERLPAVDAAFDQAFAADRRLLEAEWRGFAAELAPGYERAANAATHAAAVRPLVAPLAVEVDPARGWQATGLRMAAGQRAAVTAADRFTLAPASAKNDTPAWESTAAGISFDRHRGRRLGMLEAAVLADPPDPPVGLETPIGVGEAAGFVAPRTGRLYLRVNDRPDRRSDNAGRLRVTLAPAD